MAVNKYVSVEALIIGYMQLTLKNLVGSVFAKWAVGVMPISDLKNLYEIQVNRNNGTLIPKAKADLYTKLIAKWGLSDSMTASIPTMRAYIITNTVSTSTQAAIKKMKDPEVKQLFKTYVTSNTSGGGSSNAQFQ